MGTTWEVDMDKSNQNKYDLLGIPFGTAMNQLRKNIMFDMMKQLNKDICFRCGEKIETVKDFSIEHKKAWQQDRNPKESFYDLNNITFSHLKCNIGAGKKMERQPLIHGTLTAYAYCKCDKYKEAGNTQKRGWRKANINRKVA